MSYKNSTSTFGLEFSGANTRAELKALSPAIANGDRFTLSDGSTWRYASAATAAEDALQAFVLAPDDGRTVGRFLRADAQFDLALPVTFANTDAQVLYTIPTGVEVRVGRAYQNVTVAWTGGTSSAIGLSSSNAAYTTKGDVAGGGSGDVLAGLTVGKGRGTAGAKANSLSAVYLVAGDAIRFDRITSAFTAGAGTYVLPVQLVVNAGA